MTPILGQIQAFGFNFAPRGWAACDGQLLPINQNQALFSLLGTIYGGDGITTFALPDLRGRSPMHIGHGPGLSSRSIGQRSGQEQVTLNILEIPSHNHVASGTVKANNQPGDEDSPEDNFSAAHAGDENYSAAANATMAAGGLAVTVGNNGGNQPHTNLQPYLVINWCIALQGIFPSRN
jgi:microcystin-dependent protein